MAARGDGVAVVERCQVRATHGALSPLVPDPRGAARTGRALLEMTRGALEVTGEARDSAGVRALAAAVSDGLEGDARDGATVDFIYARLEPATGTDAPYANGTNAAIGVAGLSTEGVAIHTGTVSTTAGVRFTPR